MTLHDLIPLPDLFQAQHILCVQPHPDDNEIGAGGTIAKLAQAGIRVSYLTVSPGKGGSESIPAEELVRLRAMELEAAGRRLGVTTFRKLDLAETHYPDEKLLVTKIVEVLRELQPDVVMSVDPTLLYEAHPTHRKTGSAVLDACFLAGNRSFPDPDVPCQKPHHVKVVAFYGSAHPNTFIDVKETYALKLEAIREHRTQFDDKGFMMLKTYLDLKANQTGAQIKSSHAEAFKVLPMILTHMMVESETY